MVAMPEEVGPWWHGISKLGREKRQKSDGGLRKHGFDKEGRSVGGTKRETTARKFCKVVSKYDDDRVSCKSKYESSEKPKDSFSIFWEYPSAWKIQVSEVQIDKRSNRVVILKTYFWNKKRSLNMMEGPPYILMEYLASFGGTKCSVAQLLAIDRVACEAFTREPKRIEAAKHWFYVCKPPSGTEIKYLPAIRRVAYTVKNIWSNLFSVRDRTPHFNVPPQERTPHGRKDVIWDASSERK